jgi:ribosomal protein S18 acetylase RimI-like enzyme
VTPPSSIGWWRHSRGSIVGIDAVLSSAFHNANTPAPKRPILDVVSLIRPYSSVDREAVLDLAIRAWAPVFPLTEAAVPAFVYASFYPHGWERRQRDDLAAVVDGEPEGVDVAMSGDQIVGWVCTRLHPDDSMGEVYVLAVDPASQRRGVGAELLASAFERIRAAGLRMVMVETGDDPGHAPARAAYEAMGFERWPVARYFKDLDPEV